MLNSITVAERTWSCQLSMKKTRNGMKVSASTTSETELALRLTRSVQLLDCFTVTVFLSSVEGSTVSVVFSICSALLADLGAQHLNALPCTWAPRA